MSQRRFGVECLADAEEGPANEAPLSTAPVTSARAVTIARDARKADGSAVGGICWSASAASLPSIHQFKLFSQLGRALSSSGSDWLT